MYQPLRVRAELGAPVVLPWHGMPLDAIIAATVIEVPELRERQREAKRWKLFNEYARRNGYERELAIFRERYGREPANVWGGHSLPLATWGHGAIPDVWVFATSAVRIPGPQREDTVAFTRRFDTAMALDYIPAGDLPRRLAIAKGEFKSYYLEFIITSTRVLEWDICGIPEEIERILFYVSAVGKKRRRGYGRVLRFRVEPQPLDQSVWDENGELQRPVPVALLEAYRMSGSFHTAFMAFRPPYHDPRTATWCAVAGARKLTVEPSAAGSAPGRPG